MKRDTKIKIATGLSTIIDLASIAYLLYDFEQKNCASEGPGSAYALAAYALGAGYSTALVTRWQVSRKPEKIVCLPSISVLGSISSFTATGVSIENIYNACGGLSQVPQLVGLTVSSIIGGGLLGKFTLFRTNPQSTNVQEVLPALESSEQEYQPLTSNV